MLVLARRKNESIRIGNDIEITVLEMCGNHVKIGINAPKELTIERSDMKKRQRTHNTKETHNAAARAHRQPTRNSSRAD